MTTVKSWKDGAKVFSETPEPTMSDLWDTISRIERKIDMLGRRAGAYTTLEGVSKEEKESLRGAK